MLAEACLLAGRPEEGLVAIDSSFGNPAETWWNPEQHRLRGELLLLLPGREVEAEAAFRLSMDSAAPQAARMLELRAATSLASLLLRLGRKMDITGLLAERYAWFTEGFDTPDLQAARNLLAGIGAQP
jgi:predicted ATPase